MVNLYYKNPPPLMVVPWKREVVEERKVFIAILKKRYNLLTYNLE